jgi:hypothetical protein
VLILHLKEEKVVLQLGLPVVEVEAALVEMQHNHHQHGVILAPDIPKVII